MSSLTQRLLLLAAVASLSTNAAAAPPAIEAFGNKPAMASVDINPSGTRLAWIEDNARGTRIVMIDLASGKVLRSVAAPAGTKLWHVMWANDDTVLIDKSATQTIRGNRDNTDEWHRWVALDAAGGEDRLLLMNDGDREWVTGATLERRRTTTPGKVYMSTLDWSATKHKQAIGTRLAGGSKDSGWTNNLYEVDLRTGAGKLVATGTAFTQSWLVDETGTVIVRSEFQPIPDRFSILVKDGAGWRQLHETLGCRRLRLLSYDTAKTAIIASGSACGESMNRVWSIPLDGSPMKPAVDDLAFEVSGLIVDPLDDAVLAAHSASALHTTRWLNPEAEKRHSALRRSFRGSAVTMISRSADHNKVVVLVEDSYQVPVYYLVDFAARKADIINETYPQLAGVKLGPVREFSYEARDQYGLMGYLTVPADVTERNLPLVVMPHGGPESRDDFGFDWMAQFLASRGYAVFQPQFRGSSGFGRAHADAGRRQWGLRMQDDVTDGVQALVSQGIADPKRICIVGWSYGGYSALAGAAFTPELYTCAVSIGGVSDLPAMLRWDAANSGRESSSLAYWREHIGSPDDQHVIARSPVRSAAAFRAPVLLIHGANDTVVPISQSRAMADALRKVGKPVELVEIAGEDHWMQTSSHSRVRTLTELERFLGMHLAAAKP